jgi:hypothetical protein
LSGEPGIEGPLGFIEKKEKEIHRQLRATKVIVTLLGASGAGLEERRSMAEDLLRKGVLAIIPEDILPAEVGPSLLERRILAAEDLDLAFVNVESWGSASEFSEFRNDRKIAQKLRVLVERDHHPLYGSSKSYLSDAYLTHDAVFGHVYMYRRRRNNPVGERMPTPRELVMIISDRYRQWMALG